MEQKSPLNSIHGNPSKQCKQDDNLQQIEIKHAGRTIIQLTDYKSGNSLQPFGKNESRLSEEVLISKNHLLSIARLGGVRIFVAYAATQISLNPDQPDKVYGQRKLDRIKQSSESLIYIDDIIFGFTNPKLSKRFEKLMHGRFEMSLMGEMKFPLRLQIHQSPRGIFIYQAKYTLEILKKHGMERGQSIAFFSLPINADSNDTRKITSGGIQFLGDKLVSWMSKKQNCTAMSSAEAEYGVGVICTFCAQTEYQLADMFTKALPEERFQYLVRRIGMRCLTPAELEDTKDGDGSITTWEDLTTRFITQFFPLRRTTKLRNDILMFQQHHGESVFEAWTHFKDLLQKVPHHVIDLWLQLRDRNAEESWALLEDLALYDIESWNDPRDFAKPVKAIALPQDVSSTSDRRLIELKNQVQRLMEAHLAPTQPTQVNKVTTSCEICSGPHDTQYCMEDPEHTFVEYASSRTDEAGEGLVSNFMASQDARLSKFEADFKQHQSKMTNKIDTVLKAIIDRIAGALPSDMVKNPKLSTSPVLSARSYPTIDPQ
ncbi:MAK10-like protein [Tanacetum coccineum]|uniref:MAK10-like protein n=1 Tax=Tanacetum coccineum TaxID=301880 RepID=A0ABQ5IUW6_9ASTR